MLSKFENFCFRETRGEVRFPDNPFYNIQVNGKNDERFFKIPKMICQALSTISVTGLQIFKAFEESLKNEFWTFEKDFL